MAGFCRNIKVALTKDGWARIEDDGRGIPTAIHPTEGISAATVALTVLHGGGITGFQNGLAIAGDYMSAAAFLGVSGLI